VTQSITAYPATEWYFYRGFQRGWQTLRSTAAVFLNKLVALNQARRAPKNVGFLLCRVGEIGAE
jgi:hypothetical protein